jgi:outer membrane protein assembly factor BamE (lipoprotein component of BamABCDE complex)
MKKIKLILLVTATTLFFAACQKASDGTHVTYYKTIGEGYVFDGKLNQPIKDARIIVRTAVEGSGGLFGIPTIKDTFATDKNGYYKIRFIKKGYTTRAAELYTLECGSYLLPPPPLLIGLG